MEMLKSMSTAVRANKSRYSIVLDYKEVASDPIKAVEKVYASLGKKVSEGHYKGMQEWIKANPQGKLGRAMYSLEEYGLEATFTGGVKCISTGCTIEPIEH